MPRQKLIEVKGLKTYFDTEAGVAKAVDGVDFNVYEEEILGIVGESGSGKSVTALSITRLIPNPPGRIVAGEIYFKGQNLMDLSYEEMHNIRGNEISMIFQEPMTSLNPVFTIGMQLREVIMKHEHVSKEEASKRSIQMLELVGIPDARKRLKDYPHQFSGGMRQRVMIAMSLILNPSLLIADEPTTALDVTIQAQILELMLDMKKKHTGAAIILITHDLAVVAETCQRVIVMYGGVIQEKAEALALYEKPLHPYTQGLMGSIPRPDHVEKGRLTAIRGMVPSILELPVGCKFCTRCDQVMAICREKEPELREIETGRWVRCHLY
jgi:oligopeptide/dipeptide ABC transporter ATP-binding protein